MSAFSALTTNRFTALQSHAEWRHRAMRVRLELAKVPLSYWQFLVRLFLVGFLCFCLARLFWLLFPAPVIPAAVVNFPSGSQSVAKPSGQKSSINIDELKSLQLFGKAGAIKNEATPVVEIPSAETQLSLTLSGVVASNYEKIGRAIIGAGNKQDVYAVGAVLPVGEGVTLVKVMRDRIVINNNGQSEVLMLYQNDSNAKTKAVATHDSPAVSREDSQRMLEWEADHAEPEVATAPQRPTVSLPDQAITGLGRSMSDIVTMNTFNEGGKMVGFKLSPGRDTDKFKELGLQTGDVVIAVNGWPMSNPQQILEMYNNLGNSASLQVKRGGNVMTVDVGLQ